MVQIFVEALMFGGLTCLPLERYTGCHGSQSFWKTCGALPGHTCFLASIASVVAVSFITVSTLLHTAMLSFS